MIGSSYNPNKCIFICTQTLNANQFHPQVPDSGNTTTHNLLWDTENNSLIWVDTKTNLIVQELKGGANGINAGCYEMNFNNQFYLDTATGIYYPRYYIGNGGATLGTITPTILRPREMTMSAGAGSYIVGETIVGQTSTAIGVITNIAGSVISYNQVSEIPFQVGELVLGQTSGQNLDIVSINESFSDTISFNKSIINVEITQLITYQCLGPRILFSTSQSTGSQTVSDNTVNLIPDGGTFVNVINYMAGTVANDKYILIGVVLGYQIADTIDISAKMRFTFNN